MQMFVKWWLMFVLTLFGLVITGVMGGFQRIYQDDPTMLTFLILILCLGSTIKNGYYSYYNNEPGIENTNFWADQCTTLGFLGTVIGMVGMMKTFTVTNISDPSMNQELAKAIGTGMSTALYTTVAGLVAYSILKFQHFFLITPNETY
jgi:hypothetical protein